MSGSYAVGICCYDVWVPGSWLWFFYFPDVSTARQVKDRASRVVITVIEGSTNVRAIEQEFNALLGLVGDALHVLLV
jgi:hypothetical protein